MIEDNIMRFENHAIARIHFEDYLNLSDFIRSIEGLEIAYSEMSMLDASLMEVISEVPYDEASDSRQNQVRVVIANKIVRLTIHSNLENRHIVSKSEYAPAIITCRSSDSWVIDLIGKLNPISSIVELIKTIRDWNPDKEKKVLENNKLLQEVIAIDLTNRVKELELLEKSVELLERSGIEEEKIDLVKNKISGNIASGIGKSMLMTKSADIVLPMDYDIKYQTLDLNKLSFKVPNRKFWNISIEAMLIEENSYNILQKHERKTVQLSETKASFNIAKSILEKLPKLSVFFGRFRLNGLQAVYHLSNFFFGHVEQREVSWALQEYYKQITNEELDYKMARSIIGFFHRLSLIDFETHKTEYVAPKEIILIKVKPIFREVLDLVIDQDVEDIK